MLEQRRPGGRVGGIVGHVGEHIGAEVAVVGAAPGQISERSVGTVTMNPWVVSSSPQVTTVPVTRSVEVADPSKAAMETSSPIPTPRSSAVALPRTTSSGPSGWRRQTRRASSAEDRLKGLGLDLGVACARRRHRVVVDQQPSGHRLDAGCGDVRSTVSSTPNVPFDSSTSSAAAP